jgi:TPR repeat protein
MGVYGSAQVVALLAGLMAAAASPRSAPAACQPQDGADACQARCDAGSQQSCAVLAIMYLRGEVAAGRDDAKAERPLRRACAAKVPLGCGGLGSFYAAVRKDFKKARPLYERACDAGDVLSCESLGGIALGRAALDGSTPADPPAARKANVYYRKACELGSAVACAYCAAFIADKDVDGTAREALDLYGKACARGMGFACLQAVDLLTSDRQEWKQLAETFDLPRLSADLLQRACKLGETAACARTAP